MMATLGTFVAGQVLTAAELNAIGTWQAWTPTVTASTGTFTTTTVNLARYTMINDLVVGQFSITVTTIGTASGNMIFTTPVNIGNYVLAVADGSIGAFRENQISGETGAVAMASATTIKLARFDNGAYLTNGDRYVGFFVYERA
jgi:hypothetical protein